MLAAIAAGGFAPRTGLASAPSGGPRAGHLGWWPWWLGDVWATLDLQGLSRVVWFDATVSATGQVAIQDPYAQCGALQAALPPSCRFEVAVTVLGAAAFETVFGSAVATDRLLAGLLELATRPVSTTRAFDGVQLDVEVFDPVRAASRARFADLVERLRDAMAARSPEATLSAFFTGGPHGPWTREAVRALDHVVAQLYDAHWTESSRAGPIVTTERDHPFSVQATLGRLEALAVPRRRTLLGAPLYGFEWPVQSSAWGARTRSRGRMVTLDATPARWMPDHRHSALDAARQHGLGRDAQGSPRYRWQEADGWHQGWFEDAESLGRKLLGLRDQGYGGLALFPLGYDRGRVQYELLRRWATPG